MELGVTLSLGVAGAAMLVLAWRLKPRSAADRYRSLEAKVGKLKKGANTTREHELLRQLYALTQSAVQAEDSKLAYQTIDLIKMAFGSEVVRPDEPRHLTALIVGATRKDQQDTAAAALDAYRLMLRKLPPEALEGAVEQLNYLAAMAQKERHGFLATKTVETILGLLEKDWDRNPAAMTEALKSLKTAGALALKRHDSGLFREISTRLTIMIVPPIHPDASAELVALTGAWLHRMVGDEDVALFEALTEMVDGMVEKECLSDEGRSRLIAEWLELAGTASLRHGSEIAPRIIHYALMLAVGSWQMKMWEEAVAGVGQIVKLGLQRTDLTRTFSVLFPLLEAGRELLSRELQFGGGEIDSFRQRALFVTVRECVSLADYAARQDLVTTTGDVITDFYRMWAETPNRADSKSAKRFSQLLAVFWLRSRAHRNKKLKLGMELAEPRLLSDADMERLQFLL